jgi:hypothetical protein
MIIPYFTLAGKLEIPPRFFQPNYFRMAISPVQKTNVSSFENRSFSRMTVAASSSSSDLSPA